MPARPKAQNGDRQPYRSPRYPPEPARRPFPDTHSSDGCSSRENASRGRDNPPASTSTPGSKTTHPAPRPRERRSTGRNFATRPWPRRSSSRKSGPAGSTAGATADRPCNRNGDDKRIHEHERRVQDNRSADRLSSNSLLSIGTHRIDRLPVRVIEKAAEPEQAHDHPWVVPMRAQSRSQFEYG